MADDVYIKLSELETVVSELTSIIDEFEHATSRSEELEAAIGDPFGESKLREEAQEFEERWDDKRNELKESLEKVKEHVEGVVKGVEEWDSETAIQLSDS